MKIRRAILAAMLAALAVVGSAGAALADHTHVMRVGNGQCVVLAAHGGEKHVQLPHADHLQENRRHPLHVNVHLGQPGTRQGETVIWVQGSQGDLDNCGGYVNQ